MILLNKYIFGEIDQFKRDLAINPYLYKLSRLSKNISVAHNCGGIIGMVHHGKKLRVDNRGVAFMGYTFIEHKNKSLTIKFTFIKYFDKYEPNMNISFNKINAHLCGLATNRLYCYNNIFALSDENSIARIMNIIQNS